MGYNTCDHPQSARDAAAELARARTIFSKPLNSAHEGWAVLYEEVDELWREVQSKGRTKASMRKEAVQVAATALRFIEEVCDA